MVDDLRSNPLLAGASLAVARKGRVMKLSGTSAFPMRRQDGVVWAIVFNSTFDNQKQLPAVAMAPAINSSLNSMVKWPG